MTALPPFGADLQRSDSVTFARLLEVLNEGVWFIDADGITLFANPRMPYTEALMNSIPRLDREPGERLPSIAGTPPDPTAPRTGCGFAARCKYATDKCRNEHPELVDDGKGHVYRCFFPLGGN